MINKVFLLGRLGKDPVVKHFSADSAIAEFSLATSEAYKDKDGSWKEVTDWHNIKLPFKNMAERAEKYLKKGSMIHVEGKIKTRSYDDKDGNKRYITEIVAENIKMLDKRDSTGTSQAPTMENGGSYTPPSGDYVGSNDRPATNIDDDLPF
jgi:single-strand DNA-binding protein